MPQENTKDGSPASIAHMQGKPPYTLVMVHGFLDNGATWQPLIDALAPHDLECIAPDLRGAGLRASAAGPYTLSQAVDDVLAALAGKNHVVLIGHSMGAQIAELAASRIASRVSALVLVTPTPLQGNVLPDAVRNMLRESGGDAQAQRLIRTQFSCTLPAHLLDADPALMMGPETVRGYYDAFTTGDSAGARPSVYDGPTLLIGAQQDPVIVPEMVRDIRETRFPHARLEFIDDSGHWPHAEQPAQMRGILEDFLGFAKSRTWNI